MIIKKIIVFLRQNFAFMKKEGIEKKALSDYSAMLKQLGMLIVGDYSLALRSPGPQESILRHGQVFRAAEGRVLFVKSGAVDMTLNLRTTTMHKGDIVVFLPDSLAAYDKISPNCSFMALSFKELPSFEMPHESFTLSLNEEEQERVQAAFSLLDTYMRSGKASPRTTGLVVAALLSDLCEIYHAHPKQDTQRAQTLFELFLQTLNKEGSSRHDIPFYASRLNVTPNHLSSVIRQKSGMTVMEWVNRALVLEAKVLLRHTDLPIAEVAYRLDFADASLFARFFHRETGMSARDYRKTK